MGLAKKLSVVITQYVTHVKKIIIFISLQGDHVINVTNILSGFRSNLLYVTYIYEFQSSICSLIGSLG